MSDGFDSVKNSKKSQSQAVLNSKNVLEMCNLKNVTAYSFSVLDSTAQAPSPPLLLVAEYERI